MKALLSRPSITLLIILSFEKKKLYFLKNKQLKLY